MPALLLAGWIAALILYFCEAELLVFASSLVWLLALFSFNAFGNFGVFFEIVVATRLDGHGRRLRLMPLNAIGFGATREQPPERDPDRLHRVSIAHLLRRVRHRESPTRCLVFGDLKMPANALVEANLVVNGDLDIGEATCVHGNIKAQAVNVCKGASVHGALFANREIRLGPDSTVDGVLSVDGQLWIECAWIGRVGNAVSVSASRISILDGAYVFGELVAVESGRFDVAGKVKETIGEYDGKGCP